MANEAGAGLMQHPRLALLSACHCHCWSLLHPQFICSELPSPSSAQCVAVTMFRHSDTAPLVLSPVDSEPETEMIDNKNADKLAFKYNKSFSDFSFSPFRKQVTRSPALLEPPSLPGGQGHRSCPDLASLPRAQADSDRVKLLGQGRDESEDILTSQWGELRVTRAGAIRGPVLVTLHDIGLDYKSNFQV